MELTIEQWKYYIILTIYIIVHLDLDNFKENISQWNDQYNADDCGDDMDVMNFMMQNINPK